MNNALWDVRYQTQIDNLNYCPSKQVCVGKKQNKTTFQMAKEFQQVKYKMITEEKKYNRQEFFFRSRWIFFCFEF